MFSTYYEKFQELFLAQTPFVEVTLVETTGSAPQDPGSRMLVTIEGLFHGTIGGGKLEKKALDEALSLLTFKENQPRHRCVHWSLDQDVGMTCGGSVRLFFETHHHAPWPIVIFGAGHVCQALTRLLLQLECHITCYDTREEWLQRLPNSPKLTKKIIHDWLEPVSDLDKESFVLLMTMGHATDQPILIELLKRWRAFPYLGVIGSRAKGARLRQAVLDVLDEGLDPQSAQTFHCPIGLDLGSNHPQEIAISVVAQLIQERDRLRK